MTTLFIILYIHAPKFRFRIIFTNNYKNSNLHYNKHIHECNYNLNMVTMNLFACGSERWMVVLVKGMMSLSVTSYTIAPSRLPTGRLLTATIR